MSCDLDFDWFRIEHLKKNYFLSSMGIFECYYRFFKNYFRKLSKIILGLYVLIVISFYKMTQLNQVFRKFLAWRRNFSRILRQKSVFTKWWPGRVTSTVSCNVDFRPLVSVYHHSELGKKWNRQKRDQNRETLNLVKIQI